MKRILSVAKYDLKMMLKTKEVLFWNIAFPIILMLLFSAIFGGSNTITIDIGILDRDHSDMSQLIIDIFNQTNVTKVVILKDNQSLYEKLSKHELDAYIIIPKGTGKNITTGFQAELKVYIDNSDPNVADISTGIIKSILDGFNSRTRSMFEEYIKNSGLFNETMLEHMRAYAEAIKAKYKPVKGTERIQYKEFILTGIIGYGFLFSSMVTATASIVNERKSGTLKRLILTPIKPIEILLGKTFGALFNTLLYTFLVLAIGIPLLQPKIHLLIPDLTIVVILGSLSGIVIGLIISAIFRTTEGASGFAIIIGIFLQWFIGIWFPLEMLPPYLRQLTNYIPMAYALDVVRAILLYGDSILIHLTEILYLTIFIVILYTLGSLVLSKMLKTIEV